jgi:hypothetical protein
MKKTKNTGAYSYASANGIAKGLFNIYQSRTGKICLSLNYYAMQLTQEQITDLHLDIDSLIDFDEHLYKQAYSPAIVNNHSTRKIPKHAH